MNAVREPTAGAASAEHARIDSALLLFGVGGVGSALLDLLVERPQLRLVGIASSNAQLAAHRGLDLSQLRSRLAQTPQPRDDVALLSALRASGARRKVIVDASASVALAQRHADWLDAGFDVVSANKLAVGTDGVSWDRLRAAQVRSHCHYGDTATVGAGLPVLSTLRRLHACGDRLLSIEGVFSGSLSWLFNRFDGSRAFSGLLAEARTAGLTEPDPRVDLGGEDVARKLVILARSAGLALEPDDIEVDNPLPPLLRDMSLRAFRAHSAQLDAAFHARWRAAREQACVLRHLARLDANGRASVGLAAVDAGHPAARLGGCDNVFALRTTRYRDRPLLIQGAGAGVAVTAQALLGDVLHCG